nr:type ISP restriction/modification enzyme [Porphyrobacter sp. YT40]
MFKLYSLGVSTNRDEWVYDRNHDHLSSKMLSFIDAYDATTTSAQDYDDTIKWSRNLKRRLSQGRREAFDVQKQRLSLYRPFSTRWLYQSSLYVDELGSADAISPPGMSNQLICFPAGGRLDFVPFSTAALPSLTVLSLDANQCLPRFRYSKSGERFDNITDWALNKFIAHYGKKGMSKDAIFAYCYAVLHDPVYREKYALNLKREFPRIPFYSDFAQWAAWGEALMKLHIEYEQVEPFALQRIETPAKRAAGTHPKPVLRSNPETGSIMIDADTQLSGIPPEAWEYRLGNRSGIDWVLDQHKEKKPRDPTIAAKFNTYRFADYKEPCIDLLAKVVTVSLETVKITKAMGELDRADWEG